MKILFIVFSLSFASQVLSANEKILKLQPNGHMGQIWSMVVDKEGKVITTGEDKTVKIWNSKEGFLEREILGQIGPGMDGINYVVALSDDNKYLAVGGWYGNTNGQENVGDVRLYDYKKGKLLKVLKAHEEIIFKLYFIPNTNGLISADLNGNLYVWNYETGQSLQLTTTHENLVDVVITETLFIMAYSDGVVYAYDRNSPEKPKYTFKKAQKEGKNIQHMAIDKSGENIVVSCGTGFYHLNSKLKEILYYTNGQHDPITTMAFSPSGDRLAVVSENNSDEFSRIRVYEKTDGYWSSTSSFKQHKEYVGCVAFITEKLIASAGGENYEVAIWKSEPTKKTATLLHWLEGNGGRIYSVSLNGSQIAFSRNWSKNNGFSKHEYVFDLVNRRIENYNGIDTFSFPSISSGELSLELSESKVTLSIKKGNTTLASIRRQRNTGYEHQCFTFYKDYVVSGASYGYIEAYDLNGKLVTNLVGQQGTIWGMSVSADERFILTSSDDQTIRVWPAEKIGKQEIIYPVVSIFFGRNNEWVIWNEEGYFTASKKGASYVGYHINQGKEKEAKYYPFEQFDTKYNRPDIILESVGIMDSGIIELYKSAYLKRLKRMGLTESDLSGEMNTPTVLIRSSSQTNNQLTIALMASDSLFTLKSLNIYLNDVPVYGRNGLSLSDLKTNKIEKRIELELMSGVNKVQITVTNSAGVESLKETINVNNATEAENNLYVVALGVSNYKDSIYNLDYASKDAEDVSTLFSTNTYFKNTYQKVLVNQDVTREKIVGLKDFLSQAKRNDVVIFFIAGHGVLNKNLDYYFCTYDMDFLAPEKFGITYSELEVLFDGIKAIRKLLIMDTCHSGEVDKDDVEEVAFVNTENEDIAFRNTNTTTTIRETQGLQKTNEAVKEMFNDLRTGTGATVISSAGGAEYAMESDEWKNGLFTYCLLEGIKTKNADADKNGEIMLSELQNYISIKVAELSKGRQMPTSRFENLNLDYRIW